MYMQIRNVWVIEVNHRPYFMELTSPNFKWTISQRNSIHCRTLVPSTQENYKVMYRSAVGQVVVHLWLWHRPKDFGLWTVYFPAVIPISWRFYSLLIYTVQGLWSYCTASYDFRSVINSFQRQISFEKRLQNVF